MSTPSRAEPGERNTLCVVWTGCAGEMPEDLSRALSARRLHVFRAPDPYAAMAELCLSCRAGDAGGRAGAVLLVVEPARSPGSGLLAGAVERYAPRAVVWAYEAHAPSRLHAVTPGDAERWNVSAPARPAEPRPAAASVVVGPRSSPPLRLTEPPDEAGPGNGAPRDPIPVNAPPPRGVSTGGGPAASATPRDPRRVLTDEEIAMLLGGPGGGRED